MLLTQSLNWVKALPSSHLPLTTSTSLCGGLSLLWSADGSLLQIIFLPLICYDSKQRIPALLAGSKGNVDQVPQAPACPSSTEGHLISHMISHNQALSCRPIVKSSLYSTIRCSAPNPFLLRIFCQLLPGHNHLLQDLPGTLPWMKDIFRGGKSNVWITPICSLGLLLDLCLGITAGNAQGIIYGAGN